jgi:hypothetical protein
MRRWSLDSTTRHHLHAYLRRLIVPLAVLAAACGSDGTAAPREFPLRLIVSNNLIAPVTVSIDGIPSLGLSSGGSSELTVSSTAQWLTWISAKPLDAQGRLIPDDIAEVKLAVLGINRVLEINNVIGDQTYITARVFNYTSAAVSIGVYDGSSVSCASELPGAPDAVTTGFTQIGYYRLLPATEVRAYRDPSHCTGPYLAWPSSELKGFGAKSGLLFLSLRTAP